MYVMYTSGSSGIPKGVIGNHLGALNRVDWMQRSFPIDSKEIHVMKTSIGFVDHIAEAFQSLLHAVTLVILEESLVSDVQLFIKNLAKHRINRLVVVPSLLKAMLELSEDKLSVLKHLQFIFSSGEILPIHLAKTCLEKLPDTRLINIYGSTEVSADATYYEMNFQVEKKINSLFSRKNQKYFSCPDINLETLFPKFSSFNIPHQGTSIINYLTYLEEEIHPYSIDVSHPSFIGHMTSGLSSIMGELSSVIATQNQNTVKIETSKALNLLEREVIAKMHKLFYSLPASFYETHAQNATSCLGLILPGGTVANIQALHIAKHHALIVAGSTTETIQKYGFHKEIKRLGFNGAVIIGSKLMHYSIQKAASLIGLGTEDIRLIKFDDNYKVDLFDLNEKIKECHQQQLLIICIVGIAGTTELGSIDPLEQIGMIAKKENIFFHVDAAWGGPIFFSARYKYLLEGIQDADSITICGHKQMYLPMGTSLLLLKNPSHAFMGAVNANYQSQEGSYDQGQFSMIGSKPAQAVYIDAGLRIFGITGYQYLIERGCSLAENFANIIQKNPAFQLINIPEINIVTYRYIPDGLRQKNIYSDDESDLITSYTKDIQKAQFLKGETAVSYTTLFKNNQNIGVFRVVLSNPMTTIKDLYCVLEDQLDVAEGLMKENKQSLLRVPEVFIGSNTVPIGFPIDGCNIFLLDEFNQEVLRGEIGQICIGGTVLASGYLNNEKETQMRFISHPNNSDKKLFKTGDFGRKTDSGAIEYHGRQDQQVKIRGHRVDLLEIETYMHTIPNISQSCAIVYEQNIFAFYSLKNESTSLSSKEIRDHLKLFLPDYAIPFKYIFLTSFPLLPNGKIDRQFLFSSLVDRAQNIQKEENFKDKPSFNLVLEACQAILDVQIFDSTMNFFDLGFNSLSLNSLLIKLQDFGYDKLELTNLYSHPSINALSEFLQTDKKSIDLFKKMSKRASIIEQRQAALFKNNNPENGS